MQKARDVTRHALSKHYDVMMDVDRRAFLYMPLEHSEDLGDQDQSVALYALLKRQKSDYFDYAVRHRDVIVRFGRFPHRNMVLGREDPPKKPFTWRNQISGFNVC